MLTEVVEFSSVQIFKIQLDTVLGNWLKLTLLMGPIWALTHSSRGSHPDNLEQSLSHTSSASDRMEEGWFEPRPGGCSQMGYKATEVEELKAIAKNTSFALPLLVHC